MQMMLMCESGGEEEGEEGSRSRPAVRDDPIGRLSLQMEVDPAESSSLVPESAKYPGQVHVRRGRRLKERNSRGRRERKKKTCHTYYISAWRLLTPPPTRPSAGELEAGLQR